MSERKYEHVHCPNCGGTEVKLVGGKGKFIGSVGGTIVRYDCKSCNTSFNLVITGDDVFPDRGFGFTKDDLNILFDKPA
jgi:Zn finger protein HypA/HybF involved in hydrogenase expression